MFFERNIPRCFNCDRPMAYIRRTAERTGKPAQDVYECALCHIVWSHLAPESEPPPKNAA
jgi:hypothetical protein